jgi:hypothetical protein
MESKAVERISAYFSGRGIELSEQDKAEVHARILGHESAEDLRVFSEKAKVFYAHRGDLNDFDRTGLFSGAATLASPGRMRRGEGPGAAVCVPRSAGVEVFHCRIRR